MTDLTEWLKQFRLTQYDKQLRNLDISSPQHFQQIKNEEDFMRFMRKLNASYTDGKRLENAWRTIVPKPRDLVYLTDDEKKIQDQIHQRYQDISEDINIVQNASLSFRASIRDAKKSINDTFNQITSALDKKRKILLSKVDAIGNKNNKLFQKKLKDLKNIRKESVENKKRFYDIIIKNDTSLQKLLKLEKLLAMNVNNIDNDDYKYNDDNKYDNDDNYDHYKIIGDICVVPGRLGVSINQDALNKAIDTSISIQCKYIQHNWRLKQSYIASLPVHVMYDTKWSCDPFVFNDGNKTATLNRTGWYVLRSVAISLKNNVRNATVKFMMNKYGFYGIGDDQTEIKGFPGYKKHGWMIRNSDGGTYYNNKHDEACQFSMNNGKPPNIQNNGKCVEMSFDLSTKKITVKVDNKFHVSQALNIDVNNNVYFIWAVNEQNSHIRLL